MLNLCISLFVLYRMGNSGINLCGESKGYLLKTAKVYMVLISLNCCVISNFTEFPYQLLGYAHESLTTSCKQGDEILCQRMLSLRLAQVSTS